MRRKTLFLVLIFSVLLILSACSNGFKGYTVKFETNGGSQISAMTVKEIKNIPLTEKEGYFFEGWYLDAQFTTPVFFPFTPVSDVKLYAKYIDPAVGNEELVYELNEDGSSYAVTGYGGSSHNLYIPNTYKNLPVTVLNAGAVGRSIYLQTLYLSKNIIEVFESFYLSSGLFAIHVDGDNQNYCSVEGVLFDLHKLVLYAYPAARAASDYAIPSSVSEVQKNAFRNNAFLETLTLPASLATLGEGAFFMMRSLKRFSVNDNNEWFLEIDGVLFDGTGANLLMMPLQYENTAYRLPDSTVTVAQGAFYGCGLKSIALCAGLMSFPIAEKCRALEVFTVAEGNTQYSAIDGVLFDKEKRILRQYPQAKTAGSFIVSEGVTDIGKFAFSDILFLQTLRLPASLARIEGYAFSGDETTPLRRVEFAPNSQLASLSEGAFSGIHNLSLFLTTRKPPSVPSPFEGGNAFRDCTDMVISVPRNVLALYQSIWSFYDDILTGDGTDLAEYKVTFLVHENTVLTSVVGCYVMTAPEVEEVSNYRFDGWYDNSNFTGERISFPYVLEKAQTLYAYWVLLT